MAERRGRWWATGLLMVGAVAFGMALAGSLEWAPAGWGATSADPTAVAVRSLAFLLVVAAAALIPAPARAARASRARADERAPVPA